MGSVQVSPESTAHTVPFPFMSRVPGGHVQVKAPRVFVHFARGSQLSACVAHSSMSMHVAPVPSGSRVPGGHEQVKPPGVLVHVALGPQLSVPMEHSSTSVHVTPSPVYPGWH